MKLIDFDAAFAAYIETWTLKNADKYENVDQMEADIPDVYEQWLNTPADFCGGVAPGAYFDSEDDPESLIDLMRAYAAQDVAMPDQLLTRTVEVPGAEKALDKALRAGGDEQLILTWINLLGELDSQLPRDLYVQWVCDSDADDDKADAAADALSRMGGCAEELLAGLRDHPMPAAATRMIDVLCNFPGDDRIFEALMRLFRERTEERALFASFLCKYGDDRALPELQQAVREPEINYLDYIELCNAIESLGGVVEGEREFSGDPYYEALRRAED